MVSRTTPTISYCPLVSTLLPAEKASAEAALAQAEVDLQKTMIRAGVSGQLEQFGLRVGDLIVGIDGVDIDSVDRLHQALDESRVQKDCMLKVLRGTAGGQPLYLTVRPTEQTRP